MAVRRRTAINSDQSHETANEIIIGGDLLRKGALSDWLRNRWVPLEVEIGSGQGRFLCQLAKHSPDTRFLGVDLDLARCRIACERVRRMHLANIRIINIEAHDFFQSYVLSNSLKAVHVYFPTPYPHSIGLSSRLLTEDFLQEVYRALISGGAFRLVTDHTEYFNQICMNIRKMRWWNTTWHPPLPRAEDGLIIGTPCELRFGTEERALELHLIK